MPLVVHASSFIYRPSGAVIRANEQCQVHSPGLLILYSLRLVIFYVQLVEMMLLYCEALEYSVFTYIREKTDFFSWTAGCGRKSQCSICCYSFFAAMFWTVFFYYVNNVFSTVLLV